MTTNSLRFQGWVDTASGDNLYSRFFSNNVIKYIQKECTKYLLEVIQKNILVTENVIINTMDGVYREYRPQLGDIYSRYIISGDAQSSDLVTLIEYTIEHITYQIRTEYEQEAYNKTLDPWVQQYGEENKHGLHWLPKIKVREGKPPMLFNVRY